VPVVHVRGSEVDRAAAAAALVVVAHEVAEAVPCDVASVWCTFTGLGVQTIGDRVMDGVGRILYVDVWIRPRPGDLRAAPRALEAACGAAAAAFGVPAEDVWGTLRPVVGGRVFAGGALIED